MAPASWQCLWRVDLSRQVPLLLWVLTWSCCDSTTLQRQTTAICLLASVINCWRRLSDMIGIKCSATGITLPPQKQSVLLPASTLVLTQLLVYKEPFQVSHHGTSRRNGTKTQQCRNENGSWRWKHICSWVYFMFISQVDHLIYQILWLAFWQLTWYQVLSGSVLHCGGVRGLHLTLWPPSEQSAEEPFSQYQYQHSSTLTLAGANKTLAWNHETVNQWSSKLVGCQVSAGPRTRSQYQVPWPAGSLKQN